MTDLSQFSFEEQRRLLDLRPDGATAAVALQAILSSAYLEPQRVDIREDDGIVDVHITVLMSDGRREPATITVALSPLTRKDLSYRMRIDTQCGERADIVAAEGWHSDWYPIEEAI
ncbi:MAG: hypothetical protein M3Y74_10365 [Chloroflexota bacterium]|nr:hypothetical protein [Chloroflexota bacterium]